MILVTLPVNQVYQSQVCLCQSSTTLNESTDHSFLAADLCLGEVSGLVVIIKIIITK